MGLIAAAPARLPHGQFKYLVGAVALMAVIIGVIRLTSRGK
jgi:hypothetical protein